VAAIGDVGRFGSPQKLVSYLGLNPSVRQSGSGPAYHGRISKAGSRPSRGLLVESSLGCGAGAWSAAAFSCASEGVAASTLLRSPPRESSLSFVWHLLSKEQDTCGASWPPCHEARRLELTAGHAPARSQRGSARLQYQGLSLPENPSIDCAVQQRIRYMIAACLQNRPPFCRTLCRLVSNRDGGLEAESWILRHQLTSCSSACHVECIALGGPSRVHLALSSLSCILDAITIFRPDTVVRWHRNGGLRPLADGGPFAGGRPRIGKGVRVSDPKNEFGEPALVRHQDPWRLLKLGIEVAQSHGLDLHGAAARSAIANWKTFLRNHMEGIASIEVCLWFRRLLSTLYAFSCSWPSPAAAAVVCGDPKSNGRMVARQVTEAFPVDSAPNTPCDMTEPFASRSGAIGDGHSGTGPTSFRSPWQNGCVERLIRVDPTRMS